MLVQLLDRIHVNGIAKGQDLQHMTDLEGRERVPPCITLLPSSMAPRTGQQTQSTALIRHGIFSRCNDKAILRPLECTMYVSNFYPFLLQTFLEIWLGRLVVKVNASQGLPCILSIRLPLSFEALFLGFLLYNHITSSKERFWT